MSIRLALATGVVLLSCLAAAGAAWACNEPYITVNPSSAGPGDTIKWTLANVEPRAKYTVTVAGRAAGDGVAGDSPPTGTYEMPDFGTSPRDVYFQWTLTHEEASATHAEGSFNGETGSAEVAYRPPATSPQPAPQTPAPTAPAPSEPGAGLGVANPREKKGAAGKPVGPGPRTDPPAVREPAPRSPAPVGTVVPVAGRQVPDRTPVPARVELVEPRAEDRSALTAEAPRVDAEARIALPGPQPSRRLPLVHATGRSIPAAEEPPALPATVVVGLSVLLVLGLGAVGIWTLRGRGSLPGSRLAAGGPQWVPPGLGLEARAQDLLVEAELQELIAEERARQVAREAAAIRTGPG